MLLPREPSDLAPQLKATILTNLTCLGTSARRYIPGPNVVGDHSGNFNSFNTVSIDNHYWSDEGEEEEEEEEEEEGNGIEHIITYSARYRSNF